jgi:8-oxo-dGTP diphosphatase
VARSLFRPLVGTLAYLWDRESDTVLMVRREGRPDDDHLGKFNGLGGKLERDEHVAEGVKRELWEEAQVRLTSLRLRGTVTWSGFGSAEDDWLAFIFLVDGWEGEPPARNDEGSLHWIERRRLLAACSDDAAAVAEADLPMWDGDKHFVPLVFDDDPAAFYGTMPYAGFTALSWTFERLG